MKTHPIRSVSVMQVICVLTTVGKGVEGDPTRPYYALYDMDGNELDFGDFTKGETQ